MGRKKDAVPPVGARAKRMQARAALKQQQFGKGYGSGAGSESEEPQKVQITLILFMSIAMAFLFIEQGVFDQYSRIITGNSFIDQLIIGPGEPIFFNNEIIDKAIVSIVRGLILFLIAGIFPFSAKLYSKITDNTKTNIFVLHWGALVVVPFIAYILISSIIPIVTELIDLILY